MMIAIHALLNTDEVATIRAILADATFRDGKETAGPAAALVKSNHQADPSDPRTRDVKRMIETALARNGLFAATARPARMSPLLISRCRTGEGYGAHVDDAIMRPDGMRPDGTPLRSDVSFTVFLSGPEDYQGGDLVIDGPEGERALRLPAGSAIVYPSTTLHRVEPVTSGERLVAVGWVQSLVRDAAKREILFDLEQAIIDANAKGAEDAARLTRKSVSNLLRRWAET